MKLEQLLNPDNWQFVGTEWPGTYKYWKYGVDWFQAADGKWYFPLVTIDSEYQNYYFGTEVTTSYYNLNRYPIFVDCGFATCYLEQYGWTARNRHTVMSFLA